MSLQLNVSVFSSIDFSNDWVHHFERNECYIQKFAPTDTISVIYSMSLDHVLSKCEVQVVKDGIHYPVLSEIKEGLAIATIKDLPSGLYEVRIMLHAKQEVTMATSYIEVTDSIEDSFLLEYSNHVSDEGLLADYIVQTRMEGGLLNREKQFKIDDEKFRDQVFDIHNLGTYYYESHTLTFGTTNGVPYWIGRKANAIFSLPNVLINGVPYVRSEGAEMEMSPLGGQYPLYVFKMEVEPNSASISKIDANYRYRIFSVQFDKTYN